jgi:hypothetical protein
VGHEIGSGVSSLHKTAAIQIQAKLHAAWMKARRPIQAPFR